MTLIQPTSVPLWNSKTTHEKLTFATASAQTLTIPSGATAVMLSPLTVGGNEFWISPSSTDPSGIRLGGVSGQQLVFRLGESPTITVRGNTGSNEEMSAVYFYGNPPGGGCKDVVDLPVWDNRIIQREFSLSAGATSEVFIPPGYRWVSLSVLEVGSPNEAFVSPEDTDDTGLKIGGNTGTPMIHRVETRHIHSGQPTSNDAAGDDLSDVFVTDYHPDGWAGLGVEVGHYVHNRTDDSFGRVTSLDTDILLSHTALVHGSDNEWERLVDHYDVYEAPSMYVHNPDASAAVDVGALFFKE